MDEYTCKRASGGLVFSGKDSSLALGDSNHVGKGNRLGCSTRLNSMKGTQIGSSEKPKYPKASFRSTSSKFISGTSSKTLSSPTDVRKSFHEKQVRPALRDKTESSSRQKVSHDIKFSSQQVEPEGSEFVPVTTTVQKILPESESLHSPNLHGWLTNQTEASTSTLQKQTHQRLGSSSQDTPSSSSSERCSFASVNTKQLTRPCSQYLGSGPSKYSLKNFSCSSMSDVLSSGCSSSNIGHGKKMTSFRKRLSDGETSSSGGKSMSGSLATSFPGSSGSPMTPQALRKGKSRPTSRDGPVSVRTRRAPTGDNRMGLSEHRKDNNFVISEPILYPQLPQPQLSILESVPELSSRSFPLEAPPVFHNSFGGRPGSSGRSALEAPPVFHNSFGGRRPGSSGRSAQNRLLSSHLADSVSRGILGGRDGYRRFNMDGIAEVLSALERIGQDDESAYEQLMVLETNLLFGGFTFRDQHRDMRLDIDNMTYEELLALEEKMGTVSTALSEEALSGCLQKSIYMPSSQFSEITVLRDDDTKCSICQEEYIVGEEVGKLSCDHRFHMDCIYQWLRQKSWCPICKTSAASPSEEGKN